MGWAQQPFFIDHVQNGRTEPEVAAMPAMLRRRAGFIGKMALEVAYRCLAGRTDVPVVFCSRHGECQRSVALLTDLVRDEPLSPTTFSLSVHNAAAGLLSIGRHDQANHCALSGGDSGVEYGVIEACSLLADGASEVLIVVYDGILPEVFLQYQDNSEQPFAWAWLISSAENHNDVFSLSWGADTTDADGLSNLQTVEQKARQPAGLDVLRFQLNCHSQQAKHNELIRIVDHRRWHWRHHG
ncbi:3-oxoacyl-ACP synthase [Glaciimonas sp. GS1]|uniref:3-oxoacyl-ACP synthase n=2 Tax=Glaciimonas soli TaxID=2590999 RepID=A0A843YJ05_9BURK|nr:3-oxoacyl-ACP synthase [Glaciimonas soli]